MIIMMEKYFWINDKSDLIVKRLRKNSGSVAGAKNNNGTGHSWSSRFMLITLILLFGKAITITAQNATTRINVDPPPLGISTHDLLLKVGKSAQVFITPTDNFDPVFKNVTSPSLVLVFHPVPSDSHVVGPLKNITLKENGTAPLPTNNSVEIVGVQAGKVTIVSEIVPQIDIYNPVNIFIRVSVYKYETLNILSYIVGWIYFAAWSISFYPQIIQNYQRKSVRGLSLDFVFLNITGFTVYGVYNIGLYWFPSVQEQYFDLHPQGIIPVELNDVIFTLHAMFACGITVLQCLIYDRGSQTISDTGKMLLCTMLVFIFVIFVVAASQAITWLTFLTWCSYVKLVITLIKYIPQAYLNWYRKSTSGWSIGNVLLDFTGGVFSLTQMMFIIYNHNDWSLISGDLTKFGLGLFSILFDIFFIVQHYVLYRSHAEYEPIDGDAPVEPNLYSGEITTSNHHGESTNAEDNSTEIDKSIIVDYRTHEPNYQGPSHPADSDNDNNRNVNVPNVSFESSTESNRVGKTITDPASEDPATNTVNRKISENNEDSQEIP